MPHSELEKWNILEGDLTGRFAYYRLKFTVPGVACRRALIRITANSCYRLWLNDRPVCAGPCKGDRTRTYYEEIDLSECGYGLCTGTNVLAVQVLYNNGDAAVKQSDERAAIFGVLTPGGGHRLLVEGKAVDFEQYTCHAQAWAVLDGLPETAGKAGGDDGRGAGAARTSPEAVKTNAAPGGDSGKRAGAARTSTGESRTNVTPAARILTHAAQDADVLKVSFSTAFEWFRACEKAGVYELTKAQMDLWRALPGKGCTCCPETPKNARSDCHGWSALPMYEMLRHQAFWETAYEK